MRRSAKKSCRGRVGLTYLLLVGFTIFFLCPDYAIVGIVDSSRMAAGEKVKTRTDDTFDGKHKAPRDFVFNRSASGLSFGASRSLLRFDFKQNLRTWPVLSADKERSPPSA